MLMRYEYWIEEGKREVVRKALRLVEEKGLIAPHHLYITFKTSFPGVRIASHLQNQYPKEMTILLNEDFWNLIVTDEFFSVDLLFSDQKYSVHVPFESLVNFIDPGAEFALQFDQAEEETQIQTSDKENVIFLDRFRSAPQPSS